MGIDKFMLLFHPTYILCIWVVSHIAVGSIPAPSCKGSNAIYNFYSFDSGNFTLPCDHIPQISYILKDFFLNFPENASGIAFHLKLWEVKGCPASISSMLYVIIHVHHHSMLSMSQAKLQNTFFSLQLLVLLFWIKILKQDKLVFLVFLVITCAAGARTEWALFETVLALYPVFIQCCASIDFHWQCLAILPSQIQVYG